MCYMFYLGSDVPLPTSEWQKESPAFHLSSCGEEIKEVKRHFTKPEVYYAGSHEGCGCGFFFDKNDDPDLQFQLAETYEKGNEKEMAGKIYKKIIEMGDPFWTRLAQEKLRGIEIDDKLNPGKTLNG